MDLGLLTGTVVPTWVMVAVVGLLSVSLVVGVPLARSAGKRRGRRLAHPEAYASKLDRAKDTALFLAALLPSVLVWLAVMSVSFIGLTGFAKDVMHWNHWTNVMVPLSLDGISISFGAWAFVAVKRGRHPGRAYKIVLAAATMSAVLNFVHGRDVWSLWAGLYLAFLSMVGMAMFHELLDQFMAAYDDETALKTRYPRFGQRWFYAPFSTLSARRAWIVHPPEEGYRPSVRNALDHLEAVREAKRQRRLIGALRVREEQQAKLVEVQARNEVRHAKASGSTTFTANTAITGVAENAAVHAAAHTAAAHTAAAHTAAAHTAAAHTAAAHTAAAHAAAASAAAATVSAAIPARRQSGAGALNPMQAAIQQTGSHLGVPVQSGQTMPPQLGLAPLPQRHAQPDEPLIEQPTRNGRSEQAARGRAERSAPEPLMPPLSARNGGRGAQAIPAQSSKSAPEPVLDPAQRAELESIFPVSSGREAMGKHPLWDGVKVETQQYIADLLTMGESPVASHIRDWANEQYGFRPSLEWAKEQIRAARNRDIVGMDADLV